MRTFIAVDISEEVRQQIDDFVRVVKENALPVKWVPAANLHITVKFLGEVDEGTKGPVMEKVRDISQRYQPFNARLCGIGCFPTARKPRVLWVGMDEGVDTITKLAADIDESFCELGFQKEKRFHAHLTIGRIKKPCSVEHIMTRALSSAAFCVDSLVVYKSTLTTAGPIYEPLERFHLKKT